MGKGKQTNLLGMIPRRAREWREGEEGRVRVLVPRYGKTRVGRWFAARMGRGDIAVRLDETGSQVWKACDGRRTVGEILRVIAPSQEAPGGELTERTARYFRELEVSRFITWS